MNNDLHLPDREAANDLQAYLQRAKKLDPEGMVRLRAFGKILTAYVAPIFAGSLMDSGPTVLGLRTLELDKDAELDSVIPIQAALDRLATGELRFALPDSLKVAWAGISPPRSGWSAAGTISETLLTQVARDGIAEVADTLPESVGGPIAARIRGSIWGRAIDLTSQVPMGAAFVAAGLGFLTENEEVELYRAEGWIRLSSQHGHVLAKVASHF